MVKRALALLALATLSSSAPAQPAPPAQPVHRRFDAHEAARLVPLLQEAVRFPTVAGNEKAQADQKAWLTRTATSLGLTVRDAGPVTEIELPGPTGAPVIGLVIHGDVQPVDAAAWSVPPFDGIVRDGAVWGRGAADDKGPLVQALLVLRSLAEAGPARTRTVRLLVGTNEESTSTDVVDYLETHEAPAYSLVLDASFPVVVGEKAWNALRVSAGADEDTLTKKAWEIAEYDGGLSPSIVPDRAQLRLRWSGEKPDWNTLTTALRARPLREGTALSLETAGDRLTVSVKGRAAHNGMNLAGGRNALLSLAEVTADLLPPGGVTDLLTFAREVGADPRGAGLGLPAPDPLWNGYDVSVVLLKPIEGRPTLTLNIRRPPPWTGAQLRTHLEGAVRRFNETHHARVVMDPDFYFADEPYAVDPESPLVSRLLQAYRRATGDGGAQPVVIGGGTYAKRIPRALAFGTWFSDKPYPGHDVDERNPTDDLFRGAHVLIEALVDLACLPGEDPPLRKAGSR